VERFDFSGFSTVIPGFIHDLIRVSQQLHASAFRC
jgi:hypothetical protein